MDIIGKSCPGGGSGKCRISEVECAFLMRSLKEPVAERTQGPARSEQVLGGPLQVKEHGEFLRRSLGKHNTSKYVFSINTND